MLRPGYRNWSIGVLFLGCSTWIISYGIAHGSDLLGLATVLGSLAGGVGLVVFGRGYNKAAENGRAGHA